MPKQPQEKSAHLQELEAVFDRHTRRFSPFDVLGLRPSEQDTSDSPIEEMHIDEVSTHIGVDATHPPVAPTHPHEGATPLPGEGIHTKVVGFIEDATVTTYADGSIHPHRCGCHPPTCGTHPST
jgi:hypothetical protein